MVLTIILGTISKNFHGTIIMGPGRYDYHSFMIIAQPYVAVACNYFVKI